MAEIIQMPLLSDTMTEGVIAVWHKNVGDKINSGDLLAEIETDKATMEFESPADGYLLFKAETQKPIKVNDLLAIIGEQNENIEPYLNAPPAIATTATPPLTPTPTTQNNTTTPAPPPSEERLKTSPLARQIAKQNNINLQTITGTGDNGRIVKRDLDNLLQQQEQQQQPATTQIPTPLPPLTTSPQGNYEVPISQMRKTIARRLAESKFTAPHFYLKIDVNMGKAIETRNALNQVATTKISFNDLIIKATAAALQQHPTVNASWKTDTIQYHTHAHIGVAVALDEGLVVPVIPFANQKTLTQISTEVKTLAQKAQDKKLQPSEMQGNTFTISNLGMYDITEFTAIINPPDACILAVGKITTIPAFNEKNEVVPLSNLRLTLSCDHRIVDGLTGAKFLQTLKALLEDPIKIIL